MSKDFFKKKKRLKRILKGCKNMRLQKIWTWNENGFWKSEQPFSNLSFLHREQFAAVD